MDALADLANELIALPAKVIIASVSADKWKTEKNKARNIGKVDICIAKINNILYALNERFNKLQAVQQANITPQDRAQFKQSHEDLQRQIDTYVKVAEAQRLENVPDLGPIRKELEKRSKRLKKLLKFVRKCENKSLSLIFSRTHGKLRVTVATTMGAQDEDKKDDLYNELSLLDKDIDEILLAEA